MDGSHDAPSTRASFHLCLSLCWMNCPRDREGIFGKLHNVPRKEKNVLFVITQFACRRTSWPGGGSIPAAAIVIKKSSWCTLTVDQPSRYAFRWRGKPEPTYSTRKACCNSDLYPRPSCCELTATPQHSLTCSDALAILDVSSGLTVIWQRDKEKLNRQFGIMGLLILQPSLNLKGSDLCTCVKCIRIFICCIMQTAISLMGTEQI